VRTLNSRGLSDSFGRRGISQSLVGMGFFGEVDSTVQQRQVELAQIQAERQAVEDELADLKARAADRTAAQRSARSRGTVLPPAAATPAQSRMLEAPGAAVPGQDVGEDLMDRVGPPVSAQPSVLEQIQSAPPIALAVAGLAAVFVIRAIMKKGR